MKITINGKPAKFEGVLEIKTIQAYLENLEFGALVDAEHIQKDLGVSFDVKWLHQKISQNLKDNCIQGKGRRTYFGSTKTIKELKKESGG